MSDLIDRRVAIEAIMKHTGMTPIAKLEAETTICRVPSVEPERKKGKWIQSKEFHGYDNEFNRDAIACSACHVAFPETEGYRIEDMLEDFRYCPHCGADMREEE